MLAGFLAMLAALGAVWFAGRDGLLVDAAEQATSHGAGWTFLSTTKDVFLF